MALTLVQIQAMITNKEDPRQIINEIADYLQANPGGGGVASITAGTNVTLGGTATNPVINATGGSSYLSYVALINQSGGDAPVATEIENTLGAVVWSRFGAGGYNATLAGAFTANKTIVLITATAPPTGVVGGRQDGDAVYIQSFDTTTGNGADGVLTEASIEIRVYPT